MAHQYIFTMINLRKIVPPQREILRGIFGDELVQRQTLVRERRSRSQRGHECEHEPT